MAQTEINILEIDSWDSRFQSGVARYLDVLGAHMPPNVRVLQILFHYAPDVTDVRIIPSQNELHVWHPAGFASQTLYEAVMAMWGARLSALPNLIVKCNCLGTENLAYLIRSRVHCRVVGVLHCVPPAPNVPNGAKPYNPYFNMDWIISVCGCAQSFLDAVQNTRPVTVIYNGIERPTGAPNKKTDDVFRFVWVHGWAPHKGLPQIIPAIAQIASQHKIEVLVLGGGAPDDKIRAQIADLPIRQIGLVTDPAELNKYYQMADCALFASPSEACPFAGIEAMANQLPIISTDAPGLTEMFGRAAVWVPLNEQRQVNADAYATQMRRMITDGRLRTRCAVLGYGRYLERYTVKKMARDTLRLYNRLITTIK